MITPMKKYTFLVFHRDYESFLTLLRETGVVHINCKTTGVSEDEDLQQTINKANDLRQLLQQGAPDQLLQERKALEEQIVLTRRAAAQVAVWGTFDSKKIEQLRDAGYDLHFYECPLKRVSDAAIIVAERKSNAYIVTIGVLEDSDTLGAKEIKLTKSASELQQDITALEGLLVAQNARIEAWRMANIGKLENELREVEQLIDWKQVVLNTDSAAEGALSVLEGFCPTDHCDELNSKLNESACCYFEAEDPAPEDATPIQLRNNWFTRMFECLTGMYGWPNYGEFDPTPILGPFFLLFFALCIGDAGYGLLLILVGYLIKVGKLKIEMFDGLGPIIMALGVGSTVIGYMMGGFFGIDLYAATWFPTAGKTVMFKGLFGDNIAGYDTMMVLALGIGIVHICLAMTIKCIVSTKRFGFKETISAWGWLVLILGVLITLVLGALIGWGAEVTKVILIIIGVVSALGIFIFNKPGRNPLINIGAGLWDTYGMATGIMGDVLSYIRLYALGLAGGMLGMAFNDLGFMALGEAPNVAQWIGFIVIVTFGHVLNLLMACLGAFVHPLRLTFVEYFKNSGYEGSGKAYHPFRSKL